MKIHNVAQHSVEWFKLRAGVVTASELHRLITPLWKIRTGDGPQTYLCEKLAEWKLQGPLPDFGRSFGALEQGTILEEEAIPFYEFTTGETISRVGFITTDDGRFGCSPDGLIQVPTTISNPGIAVQDGWTRTAGIEIKCPQPHTHVGYLLDGVVPPEYLAQIHGSMYVTGFQRWKFMSFSRSFEPLILTVERDEKILPVIKLALEIFAEKFESGKKKLGGA